jgi:phosphatidylinositol 3-kinase
VEADPKPESSTPSDVALGDKDEMGRLEDLIKDHERGDIPKVDWLDLLAFREIERLHSAESGKSNKLFLYVDLPRFNFPVVYSEQEGQIPLPPLPVAPPSTQKNQNIPLLPSQLLSTDSHLWKVYDPDAWRENPVEIKHRKLLRSQRLGDTGKDLKPSPADRDRLNEIFRLPPTASLSAADKDLLWKYRYSLFRSPRSLTKFLKCVTWSDPVEAKQAVEKLLPLWGMEVEIDDALEMLGPGVSDTRVRAFAVRRLRRADDEELQLYLLQLIQALKFEVSFVSVRTKTVNRPSKRSGLTEEDSGLARFLIDRSAVNPVLGTAFHWYLWIECEERGPTGEMYGRVAENYMTRLVEVSLYLITFCNYCSDMTSRRPRAKPKDRSFSDSETW